MNTHSRKFWPPPGKDQDPRRPGRLCDHPGCGRGGEYRAPKSRDRLTDYYWFCLDHVRAYNQSWDYYAGLAPDEIEDMLRHDTTWQRPTWPLGRMGGHAGEGRAGEGRAGEARAGGAGRWGFDSERVRDGFGFFEEELKQAAPERRAASAPEQAAMREMNLTAPLTVEGVKARYKELCKLHHPDANGGDKAAEERFKRLGQAYKTLMESLNP